MFNAIEDANGLRMPFHVLPTNRIDSANMALPYGCLYSPLHPLESEPCQYEPVQCPTCRACLNPYAQVDFQYKTWTCPLCRTRSQLPASYNGMTEQCLPAELLQQSSTIEYVLPATPPQPPIFLFVVDACSRETEHQHLKSLLVQAVASLPQGALVGIVTFGAIAYVHELRFSECPRSYVFNGTKTYTTERMREFLGVTVNEANPFLVPVSDAEQMLNGVIDYLESDAANLAKSERPERCTGAALDYAISLLGACFPGSVAQVILFTSGPITKGPGTMATTKKADLMRQHKDIEAGKAPMTTASITFFEGLKKRAAEGNVVVNAITASFEETGLYELSCVVSATGGFMMFCESWSDECIGKTLVKYFDGGVFAGSGADCRITVQTTKDFKVCGCIGPCTATGQANPDVVSEKVVGQGASSEWKACGILPNTTFAFVFDVPASKAQPVPKGSVGYMQFVTRYRHLGSGQVRLRVTTWPVKFADLDSGKITIAQGVDQEAAAVLIAKVCMWRILSEETVDVVHSIDRMLIKFCRLFGTYQKGDAVSFMLDQSMQFLPQFLYHFRRSPFLATFNSSPDQTMSLRHALISEDTTNCLFMIQPTLLKYSLEQEPQPVLLDLSSIQTDCVLLLDTFFKVLVWHGSKICAWRNEGYQNQEEFVNLKRALEEPLAEAQALVEERFPTPTLIVCDQGSSQERGLLSRCNPSSVSTFDVYGGGDNLSTDEPSLSTFMQKLKEMAVVP